MEVVSIFKQLKQVFPSPSQIQSTNFLFRLHAKFTTILLLLFSLLTFVQQILGVHLKCLVPPDEDMRSSAINQYCFITGTYTVPTLYSNPNLTTHVGIGNHIKGTTEQKFHHYFQWVPYILILQGLAFYLPHSLWKTQEFGRLRSYCRFGLNQGKNWKLGHSKHPTGNEYEEEAKLKELHKKIYGNVAEKFVKSVGYNKPYSIYYLMCELLNFLLVLGSFWSTDWFLSGQFQNFGLEWMRFMRDSNANGTETKGINPMAKLFPKVTKCDFQKFGPSGSIVKYDIVCILTLNVINEKIFLFLWYWFAILFLMGGVQSIYRVVLVMYPSVRNYVLLKNGSYTGAQGSKDLKAILKKLGYCDWFLLKRISDNLDSIKFGDFCTAILEQNGKITNFEHKADSDRKCDDVDHVPLFRQSVEDEIDSYVDNVELDNFRIRNYHVPLTQVMIHTKSNASGNVKQRTSYMHS